MALLLLGCEADCLVPQHKQIHVPGSPPPPGQKLNNYRASGLVHRPVSRPSMFLKADRQFEGS